MDSVCRKGRGSESQPGKGKGKKQKQRDSHGPGRKGKENLRAAMSWEPQGSQGSAGHLFLEEGPEEAESWNQLGFSLA